MPMLVFFALFVFTAAMMVAAVKRADRALDSETDLRRSIGPSTDFGDEIPCPSPHCSKMNSPKAKYCAACGYSLKE